MNNKKDKIKKVSMPCAVIHRQLSSVTLLITAHGILTLDNHDQVEEKIPPDPKQNSCTNIDIF